MRTLYLNCNMGAAGDMLMAALLELHPDREDFLRRINGLGLPGVRVEAQSAQKCGIQGTHMSVTVHGEEEGEHHHHHGHDHGHHHDHNHDHHEHHHAHHHHTTVADIRHILSHLSVSEKVRSDAVAVYDLIAAAESHAHGCEIEQIHFHEVGTLDAVADVVGVCMLMEELEVDQILASPVHVGSGQVKCAHGILPVPAPATAYILRDVPIYGGEIRGELCTPTGAALLRHFVSSFGAMPVMKPVAWGYGMGTKDFSVANCVRALLGETEDRGGDQVWELACNLDDMTGEEIGFACEVLLEAGALDVWTTALGMKKGRPGVMLSCLCRETEREELTQLLLRHTTTLGVRSRMWERTVLERRHEVRETAFGPVRYKVSSGDGFRREKAEYEDLARIAREQGIGLAEVKQKLK